MDALSAHVDVLSLQGGHESLERGDPTPYPIPMQKMAKFWRLDGQRQRFPHAIADFFTSRGITLRERRMLEFINQITDKPGWERKIYDEEITRRWRSEASRPVVTEDSEDVYLSDQMFDFCISELKEKASRLKETGYVHVLDAEVTVAKSDVAVSDTLKQSLKTAVRPLENIPDREKDWHPGSDGKVLDLVHPSLFPVIHGQTRAYPATYGPEVRLESCCDEIGRGHLIPQNYAEHENLHFKKTVSWGDQLTLLNAWGSFQWLPSAVRFDEDGKAKITSYINNLHPKEHESLYSVLETFLDATIPLWNDVLSYFHNRIRIPIVVTSDEDYALPDGLVYPRTERNSNLPDGELQWDDEYIEWKREHRYIVWPEPREFKSFKDMAANKPEASLVDLRADFKASGLQVIFKLASIHLTPEKSKYNGGTWHVEGALNEHICATALYYYDQENITDSHLAFRQPIDVEEMVMLPAQNEFESAEEFFGIKNLDMNDQELGEVLTKEGRLLCFPNVLQHRVGEFELVDPTKSGHRKVLAMFLVDPHIPILGTDKVPPQRRDWWATEVRKAPRFATLPQEIFEKIIDRVEDFPISWEAALNVREKLMQERAAAEEQEGHDSRSSFSFCEH